MLCATIVGIAIAHRAIGTVTVVNIAVPQQVKMLSVC